MLKRFAFSVVISLSTAAAAQIGILQRAYVGSDGLAHVVDRAGTNKAVPKEPSQVEIGIPKLSNDRRFAGWTISVENCCTSYPIPTRVSIYSGNRIVELDGDGQMIYDWCFVPGKAQVAVSTGPTHGDSEPAFKLSSALSGKALTRWEGYKKVPAWARCLKR